jgi:hypothetical protein
MARLRIEDLANPTLPGAQGYIKVVRELYLKSANYTYFIDDNHKNERPTLLQGHASPYIVRHDSYNDPREPIDNTNCRIITHIDREKKAGIQAKHHMNFPETNDYDVSYLQPYVTAMQGLGSDLERCEFLFGLMLLTRCR